MAEASSLVETLDQKFLECGICLQRFQRPRGLPCLHSFCHECLDTLCEGKKEVLCPNCKRSTRVPDEGVSGFPAHFMVNSLQETVDMEKLKINMVSMDSAICRNCKKPNSKVSVQCLDCNLLFCDSCHQAHDLLEPMRAHQVITVEDLQSKKTLIPLSVSKDRTCENHDGEQKRFYCETCNKPVCRDCIVMKQFCRDHDYISLKDAAKKQASKLMELTKKCKALKTECQAALQATETVEKNFKQSLHEGKRRLETAKTEFTKKLEASLEKCDSEMESLKSKQANEFVKIRENIQSTIEKVENACELSTNITQMGSHYDITSIYTTLSTSLEELAQTASSIIPDDKLGQSTIKAVAQIKYPQLIKLKDCWKKTGQFYTIPALPDPHGISVNPDGDVAVTSCQKQVAVFSQNGTVIRKFNCLSDVNLSDVAVTKKFEYILPGKTNIRFFDTQGREVTNKKNNAITSSVKDKPCNPNTLAVDQQGRIVAGLEFHAISIHDQDGALISKFSTLGVPRYLDVTPEDEIFITQSYNGNSLWKMDFNGDNKRKILPPSGVKTWIPMAVCCSPQDEVFVVNTGSPKGVYCFKSSYRSSEENDKLPYTWPWFVSYSSPSKQKDYECSGIVIEDLEDPRGIAISEDGQQLFVVEHNRDEVQIYQRHFTIVGAHTAYALVYK